MANNPFFDDTTILKESTYLSELKEQTKRIDPLTRKILERENVNLLNEEVENLVTESLMAQKANQVKNDMVKAKAKK